MVTEKNGQRCSCFSVAVNASHLTRAVVSFSVLPFHLFRALGKTQSERPTASLPGHCPQRSAQQERQRQPTASKNQHHGTAATVQPASVCSGLCEHEKEGHGAPDHKLSNYPRGDGFSKTSWHLSDGGDHDRQRESPPAAADRKQDPAAARVVNDHPRAYDKVRTKILLQDFSVGSHLPVSPIKSLVSPIKSLPTTNAGAPPPLKYSPIHLGELKLSTSSNISSEGTGETGDAGGNGNRYAAAADQTMSPPLTSTGRCPLRGNTEDGNLGGGAGPGRRRRTTGIPDGVLEGDDGDTGGRRSMIQTLTPGRHRGHRSGTDEDGDDFGRHRLHSSTLSSGEERGSLEGGWGGSGHYGEGRTTTRSWMVGGGARYLLGSTGGRIGEGQCGSISAGMTREQERERLLAAMTHSRPQATVERALASAMAPGQILGNTTGGSGGEDERGSIGNSRGGLYVRDLELRAGLALQHGQHCPDDDAQSELVNSTTPPGSGTDHDDDAFLCPSATLRPRKSTIESYLESYHSREKRAIGRHSSGGEGNNINSDGTADELTKVRSKILTPGRKREQQSSGHPAGFSAGSYYPGSWETAGTSTATLDGHEVLLAQEDELSQPSTPLIGVCDDGPAGDKPFSTPTRQGDSGSGTAARHGTGPPEGQGTERGLQDRNASQRNRIPGSERATEKRTRAERGREQRRRSEIEHVANRPIQSPPLTRRDTGWSPGRTEGAIRRGRETEDGEDRRAGHSQGYDDQRIEGATLDGLRERGRVRSRGGSRSNSRQRCASRDDPPPSPAAVVPQEIHRYSREHAGTGEENGRAEPVNVSERRATIGSMPQEVRDR